MKVFKTLLIFILLVASSFVYAQIPIHIEVLDPDEKNPQDNGFNNRINNNK